MILYYISSVESHKGVNDIERCFKESHKGAIVVQSLITLQLYLRAES